MVCLLRYLNLLTTSLHLHHETLLQFISRGDPGCNVSLPCEINLQRLSGLDKTLVVPLRSRGNRFSH